MSTRTLICDVEIPGNPVTKARPRVVTSDRIAGGQLRTVTQAYTPTKTADAEERIAWAVKAALVGGADESLYEVEARFFEGTRSPRIQADVDNLQKLIGDALNGIVWVDDRQIVKWIATIERGAKRPRTELRIYQLGERQ